MVQQRLHLQYKVEEPHSAGTLSKNQHLAKYINKEGGLSVLLNSECERDRRPLQLNIALPQTRKVVSRDFDGLKFMQGNGISGGSLIRMSSFHLRDPYSNQQREDTPGFVSDNGSMLNSAFTLQKLPYAHALERQASLCSNSYFKQTSGLPHVMNSGVIKHVNIKID